jgi:uncharacterized tellurite resistance protein B-like protein
MDLKKLFGISKDRKGGEEDLGELFAGVQAILKDCSEGDIQLITGFAGLLGKVAYADMEISKVEIDRIRAVLSGLEHVNRNQADLIIELLGRHSARLFSIEDFIYIRLLNGILDKPGKMDLLKALFKVAAADQSVSAEEDASIWTAAKGLKLSHRDFISVRSEFAKHLDVLKSESEEAGHRAERWRRGMK